MRHGSLFSGIGGFDLASEWMGWENIFHCEWNEFGQKVLKYYWPKAITYNDITKTDFSIHRGTIDILTGGFPCQPYSSAGKRLGKEDSRHLWPEMLRTIREIQPTWVVGENVRGLTNWNGGLVFDEVQADLEAEGYEVTPFLLPACAVGAVHRRDRIWFVAYSASASQGAKELRQIRPENGEVSREGTQTVYDAFRPDGIEGITTDSKSNDAKRISEFNNNKWQNSEEKRSGFWNEFRSNGSIQDVTDSNSIGQEWRCDTTNGKTTIRNFFSKSYARTNKRNIWQNFPTSSPICDGNDGISDRLDGITFSKWRNESIKAGGNAIVPQVVYQIFKAIEQYNELDKQLSI
jgi:DNA (cytosine-5)-methyltransferase 1